MPRSRLALLSFGVLALLVYGSLLPFNLRPMPVEVAWERFLGLPWLALGPGSRADWVANLVLYVPLGYLLAATLWPRSPGRTGAAVLAGAAAWLLCAAAAVAIEFAQLFFPPRTVSMNDLVAEGLGAALGIALWASAGPALGRLWREVRDGTPRALVSALVLYTLGYLALSLFPYDFVISAAELRGRLEGSRAALVLAGGCRGLRCAAGLAVEVAAVAPIGVLLGILARTGGWTLARALAIGLGLGVAVEGLQLLVLSGVSQGASVVTRGLGVALGFALAAVLTGEELPRVRRALRPLALVAAVPYAALVAMVSGWTQGEPPALAEVPGLLAGVRWLPFYYHYYTSEPVALASLLGQLAMYAPVGLGWWLWRAGGGNGEARGAAGALLAGFLAAVVVEAGRVGLAGLRPNPTSLLIAAVAAGLAWTAAAALWRWTVTAPGGPAMGRQAGFAQASGDRGRGEAPLGSEAAGGVALTPDPPGPAAAPAAAGGAETPSGTSPPARNPDPVRDERAQDGVPDARAHGSLFEPPAPVPLAVPLWQRLLALLAGLGAAAGAATHPLAPLVVAGGLLAYGAVLWRWPLAWLVLLPASLPLLDLAPWTGRFFLDELDLLVLATVSVKLWTVPLARGRGRIGVALGLVVAALVVAHAIALWNALDPLPPLDLNAFSNYYSRYNGLRIAKGLVLALLLLPFLLIDLQDEPRGPRRLVLGTALGLAGVGAWVAYERFLFSGLLDFHTNFRVIGPFSGMHTGGHDLDAYLVLALPFAVHGLLAARSAGRMLLLGAVASLAAYAVLVTFSRITVVAAALTLVALLAALWRDRGHGARWQGAVATGGVLVLTGSLVVSVLGAGYLPGRFKQVLPDVEARLELWRHGARLMDPDWATRLRGMGLGSYPRVYAARNTEGPVAAYYELLEEPDGVHLRLHTGDNIYVGQQIRVRPGEEVTLEVELRTEGERVGLGVPICEKNLQYSFRCRSLRLGSGEAPGEWVRHRLEVDLGEVGAPQGGLTRPLSRRPVNLALIAVGRGGHVDVREVRLTGADGRAMIRNGDFEAGMSRWLFASDRHVPWQLDSLWVQAYFEQGWLGVLALGALFALALYRALLGPPGGPLRGVLGAALLGVLVVGLVGSVLESSRVALLVYLVALLAASPPPGPSRVPRSRSG